MNEFSIEMEKSSLADFLEHVAKFIHISTNPALAHLFILLENNFYQNRNYTENSRKKV